MSIGRRTAAAVAIAAIASAALAGCVGAGSVATKTNAILHAVEQLPGVVEASTEFNEHTVLSFPHSRVNLVIADSASVDQVTTILTTFAHTNTSTGLKELSSQLDLSVKGKPDTLELLWSPISDKQAGTLAEGWAQLRDFYASTKLGMTLASGDDYKIDLSVTSATPTFEDDLTALHDAQSIFATLGPVGRYENDRFSAENGIPDDAALATIANLRVVLAADGQDPDLRGGFDGLLNRWDLVADVGASTDAATGMNAAAVRAVDVIPAAAPGIALEFHSAADQSTIVTFDDSVCDIYVGLAPTDPARQLAEYWARDGRTLLDGSTIASCFA